MATNIVSSAIVLEVLRNDNYATWSVCVKNYLLAQDLWDIVEATTDPPNPENAEEAFNAWRKKNAAALHAIQISCGPNILSQIKEIDSAKIAWETLAKIHEPPSLGVNPGTDNREYRQFQDLIQAINKGDLDGVKNFIRNHHDAKNAKIIPYGWTALHVSSNAGNVKIVEELVQLMSAEDLEIQDLDGSTALTLAARNGKKKMAECMIRKNKKLVSIANNRGDIPVVVACLGGHKDMTRYLYYVTPIGLLIEENDTRGSLLLVSSITAKILDVALDLIRQCPRLATVKNHQNTIPLATLSSMPSLFRSGCRLSISELRIYFVLGPFCRLGFLLELFGIKKIYDMKLIHLHALEILRCMCTEISTLDSTELHELGVSAALFEAIKYGIVEVVLEMIRSNPALLYVTDMNSRGIFMSAIEFRQAKIFSLIYGLDMRKDSLVTSVDKFNNNMLHIAGLLAPSSELAFNPGAALQMQREVRWYKEVESICNPIHQVSLNKDNEMPRQVFTKNHKDMLKQGEEWMKSTATACTVIAALIITITFTAAFTIPGGNDQNTGYPMFLHKTLFTIFMLSDAASLFASSTSALMFLTILTSRYAEEDFLKSLPGRLAIGLSTLFFCIGAMVVAFCAAVAMMVKGQWAIVIPIILLALYPVYLFNILLLPLAAQAFFSTFGSVLFDRKMKCWL